MSQYDASEGFRADLPELVTGRYSHACSGYYDGDNLVLLVTGGLETEFSGEELSEDCW